MAILNRLLGFLELLEQFLEFIEFLQLPTLMPYSLCLVGYEALVLTECDTVTSAVLAVTAAVALHCTLNNPEF